MKHQTPGYLCLSDMLDQDLSAYEYFQTLPSDVRRMVSRISMSCRPAQGICPRSACLETCPRFKRRRPGGKDTFPASFPP